MEAIKEGYLISTDQSKLDLKILHDFLSHSYWAGGIPMEVMKRSIENSLCFGMYFATKQIGFARVVSDFATYAYLADVFIAEEERGKGLSKWMIQCIIEHPQLQGLRRFMLATRDAHDLYSQYGFSLLNKPERWMERHNPDVYRNN
jgi:GNAT superfamily N-acetyltransferase